MATLLVFKGESLVHTVPIGDRGLTIGRLADNDVVLPDDGKAVSRHHAELHPEGDQFLIRDLDSQNGTWVAASRVTRALLAGGQEAVIGPYRLRIDADDTESAARLTVEAPAAVTRPFQRGSTAVTPVVAGSGTRRTAARSSGSTVSGALRSGNRNVAVVGAAAVAALALLGLAGWFLLRAVPAPDQTQAAATTTSVPGAAPVDPEIEQVQQATRLLESGSIGEAVTRYLEPLLLANPANAEAGLIWTRAQLALAPPIAPAPAAATAPPPKPLEPGIPRLASETDAAYLNRIGEARSHYEWGERLLAQSEWPEALQVFERLAATYPEFKDVGAKAQVARSRIRDAASAAMESGRKHEDAGDFQAAARDFARAKSLGIDADGDIVRVNASARVRAQGLMKQARMLENYADRNPASRDEAVKLFRQIVGLLPAGDPDREYAEARLVKLAP